MLHTIVTLNPSTTYAGEPILTTLSPGGTLDGGGMNVPSSMSGGIPNNYTKINKSE